MKLSSVVSVLLVSFTTSGVHAATTPGLINQAAKQGSISSARRLELLAYWIYEPSSLPVEFKGEEATFGTHYVHEIQQAVKKDSGASQELLRVTGVGARRAATYCNLEDAANNATSTNFAFNYGNISGGLSIEDYKTSMETVFNGFVTLYGWPKPPLTTDNMNSGPGKYPVQVAALGDSLYGYTITIDGMYTPGAVGDNPNTADVTETASFASCMVLNEDFSLIPGLTAKGNLDATTSYGYASAIRFAVGDAGSLEDSMWFASVATYMEDELFDSVNLNYEYLFPDTTNCLGAWPNGGAPLALSEYSNFVMFRHVAEHNGGANKPNGGENVIQKLWENIGQGQTGLNAFNAALVDAGTNLNDAFHKYAIAIRFSKKCGAGYSDPYCFEEGDAYVSHVGDTVPEQGTVSVVPGSYSGSVQDHYAINYVDLPTTGSYIVSLKNTAPGGSIRGTVVCDNGSSFKMQTLPAVVGPSEATELASFFDATGCTNVTAVLTNQAKTVDNPSVCFSHTYTLSTLAGPTPPVTPTMAPTMAPTSSGGGDGDCRVRGSGLFFGGRCK